MWFKHRAWIPIAWGLAIINVGAIWFAARPGETWHATGHGVLAVALAVAAERLTARQRKLSQQMHERDELSEQKQDAVDAMHARMMELEERVDFAERMLASRQETDTGRRT